jgi:hypothetical protein
MFWPAPSAVLNYLWGESAKTVIVTIGRVALVFLPQPQSRVPHPSRFCEGWAGTDADQPVRLSSPCPGT